MTGNRLRVGLIGCGNIGSGSHLPAWLANRELVEVVALADPTEATLSAAARSAGLTDDQTHCDPLDLIDRPDVDAIDICTPQHLRRELIVAAASHGKHVLCEKPLSTIPAQGAEALQVATDNRIVLAMVHNYLWLPEIQTAQRVIDSGEIGEVRTVTVNYLGIVDVPGTAGYAPRWRHDAALAGGGVLMDVLHGVYVAESLLGSPLLRVSAYADNRDAGSNVEDLALCRFETHRNAGLVNIAWGYGPGGIEVTGTAGRISVVFRDGGTAPWSPLDRVLVTTAAGTRVELQAPADAEDDYAVLKATFHHVVRDFVQAALTDSAPRAAGMDGQRILEATVGALKSAATGETIEIPLDRDDPVFQHGVLGVGELDLPDWSPVRTRSLYRAVETTSKEHCG
jgi:predicted dehydrogenase